MICCHATVACSSNTHPHALRACWTEQLQHAPFQLHTRTCQPKGTHMLTLLLQQVDSPYWLQH